MRVDRPENGSFRGKKNTTERERKRVAFHTMRKIKVPIYCFNFGFGVLETVRNGAGRDHGVASWGALVDVVEPGPATRLAH